MDETSLMVIIVSGVTAELLSSTAIMPSVYL